MCRHVLFGFAPNELRSVPCVFVYLLNVCKFFIWLARNDFRFQDVRLGEPGVIAKVRARVHRKKFKIPTLGEDGDFIGLLLGHHWIMKMKSQHW